MSFSPSRHSQNWAVRTTKIRPFLIRNNYRLNYNFRLNVLRMSNLFSPLPSLYLAIYLKLTTGIYNTNPRGKFLPQQLETSKTDINLMQQHRPPLWNFREKNIFSDELNFSFSNDGYKQNDISNIHNIHFIENIEFTWNIALIINIFVNTMFVSWTDLHSSIFL